MGELASKIRAKYPGAYDSLQDTDLEAKVMAKYPGVYDHMAGPKQTVTGNPSASPAETERMRREFVAREGTAGTQLRDMANSAFNPNVRIPAADSLGDFAGRVLPQSLTQLGPKMLQGVYEGIKGQTDPLVRSLSTLQPTGLPGPEMERNAGQTIRGLAEATAAPTGLMGLDRAKEAWLTDPAGSALAVAPIGLGALKGAGAVKAAGKKLVGTPESLARSALKPYIGDSAARQQQATKGVQTAISDKNASARMPKFMERNLAEMEQIAGRQEVLLNNKGNPAVSIQGIRDALKGTVDDARNTPGTADAAVSAAGKVLDDITNHPAYDAATDSIPLNTVQTMKRNIWRKLREGGTFNKDAVPGLQDAMWDSATGMNEIINKHVPEMAGENARYGELANVNKLLKRSIDRHANNNIIPLRALIQMVRGDVKGFSTGVSVWALDHPTFKMYLAQRMAKAAKGKTPSPKQVDGMVETIKADLVQREQTILDAENLPKVSNGNLGDAIPGGYQREYGWEGAPKKGEVLNPESLPVRQSSQMPVISETQGRIVPQQEAMAPRRVGVERNLNPDAPAASQLIPNLLSSAKLPTKAPMTWRQFLSENMGAAMKSEGSHGAAIRKLAKEWKTRKTE